MRDSYLEVRQLNERFERDGLAMTFRGWCYPLEAYRPSSRRAWSSNDFANRPRRRGKSRVGRTLSAGSACRGSFRPLPEGGRLDAGHAWRPGVRPAACALCQVVTNPLDGRSFGCKRMGPTRRGHAASGEISASPARFRQTGPIVVPPGMRPGDGLIPPLRRTR